MVGRGKGKKEGIAWANILDGCGVCQRCGGG